MIELNESTFLYQYPMLIRDPKHMVKISSKTIDDKDKQPDQFLTRFAQYVPDNIEVHRSSLFSNFTIDNDYLKKVSVKEIDNPFGKSGDKTHAICFNNLAVFKTTTVEELKYMLAYVFELNITNINIQFRGTLNKNNVCSNGVPEALKEQGNVHNHQIRMTQIVGDLMVQTISIGNCAISVEIVYNTDNRNNIYEEVFYNNYHITATYVKKLLINTDKQKVVKYPLHMNISQLTVTLMYCGPKKTHANIDISRLFNLHHAGKLFSKIYIHSDNIDQYMATPRQMQYIKSTINGTNVFKGINSMYNTCSLYLGLDIDKGFALHHFEVCTNMTINVVFTNTNIIHTYDQLMNIMKTWLDNNLELWLKKLRISECVYNIGFNVLNYVPILSGINSSVNVNGVGISDIENLSEIMLQNIPQLKFPTRTSIQFSGYSFFNIGCYYKVMYQSLVHEFLTSNILYKDMFPVVHVGMNGTNDLTISITNSNTLFEAMFMYAYVIGSFKKILQYEGTIESAGKLDIEVIRKNAMKYNKNLLKILMKIDPALFGTRKIGKNVRSFSGLCQKAKQRVVPITVTEYDYLKNIVPDSVTNLRNQTFPEQRLYLFCPYKKYSFLNFHHFPNQLCIVRCTTKPSNKTQYNYCVNSLGAEYQSNIQNKYENQTITLYNPLITRGRKCRLPEELKFVLVDYVLLKLNINVSANKYCLSTFDKHAFVIRRDPLNNRYAILSEYNDELDYVLILQSELNEEFFIFINEVTGKPLIFSMNPEIKRFFIDRVQKTEAQFNFFNYLEKLLRTNISQYYNKINKEILNILKNQFDLKYIINGKFIRGIIWKNSVCLTPMFYWQFEDTDIHVVQLFKAIDDLIKGKYDVPSIEWFDKIYIKELYMDYISQKIRMINFYGNNMLVKPFELTHKWSGLDVMTFDYEAILLNLYNINIGENDKFVDTQIQKFQIGEILKNYIYIYIMEFGAIDEKTLTDKLISLNIVFEGNTFIDYADRHKKDMVLWRTSKINRDDYNDYIEKYQSFDVNDNIKNIYEKFQNEIQLKCGKDEVIHSKIITI